MAEIIIDTYLCSGCATCVELVPAVFCLDPVTDKAALVSTEVDLTDAVREAAAYCPEKRIELVP